MHCYFFLGNDTRGLCCNSSHRADDRLDDSGILLAPHHSLWCHHWQCPKCEHHVMWLLQKQHARRPNRRSEPKSKSLPSISCSSFLCCASIGFALSVRLLHVTLDASHQASGFPHRPLLPELHWSSRRPLSLRDPLWTCAEKNLTAKLLVSARENVACGVISPCSRTGKFSCTPPVSPETTPVFMHARSAIVGNAAASSTQVSDLFCLRHKLDPSFCAVHVPPDLAILMLLSLLVCGLLQLLLPIF